LNFDQVWQTVQTLTPRQQRRLRKLLDALRFMHQPLTPEEQLLLLKDGVIDQVPRPLAEADRQAFQEYKPVPIEGKPLSETIIEERRQEKVSGTVLILYGPLTDLDAFSWPARRQRSKRDRSALQLLALR
jgi:hypothetical protein